MSDFDTTGADVVPSTEPTSKRKWVSDNNSRIKNAIGISDCKCGRPRVRVVFVNGYSIDVHDDGSFIEWTGEM